MVFEQKFNFDNVQFICEEILDLCRVSVTEIDFTFNELELFRKMSINSQPWYCLSSIHFKFSNLSFFQYFYQKFLGKYFPVFKKFWFLWIELTNNFELELLIKFVNFRVCIDCLIILVVGIVAVASKLDDIFCNIFPFLNQLSFFFSFGDMFVFVNN